MTLHDVADLDSEGCSFYRTAIDALLAAELPFLVGGAYALETHAGIVRRTKDFDIFMARDDALRALDVLAGLGYESELTFPHWLGKSFCGEDFVDIIFSSGNGVCTVDAEWFQHAPMGTALGRRLPLCPAEETIWQKAFILERDRCDSADVAHLLRSRGASLDWPRLLRRFGPHWRVLYAHLVLFGFIFPDYKSAVPGWVMEELAARLAREQSEPQAVEPNPSQAAPRVCQGTLLSATQYLRDIDIERFVDARLTPAAGMTVEQVRHWTANFKRP